MKWPYTASVKGAEWLPPDTRTGWTRLSSLGGAQLKRGMLPRPAPTLAAAAILQGGKVGAASGKVAAIKR
jgi:hypothetical protein